MKLELEINKKSKEETEEFIEKIKDLPKELSRLTVVDKNKDISNLPAVKFLDKEFPDKEIMPHYSIQNHYSRKISQIADKFYNYLEKLRNTEVKNLLLISGPKERNNTSLDLLNFISKSSKQIRNFDIAVAFNPYKRKNLREERLRLKSKLKHDFVIEVYFQIGTEPGNFEKGVEFVRNVRDDVKIKSCLVIPSQTFLSKFKARPWKGVYLSEKYLNDLEFAKEKTKEMFDLAKSRNVTLLVECPAVDISLLNKFLY
jgi:5,10-methylenetetrahydrofolate reductase